MDERDPPPDSGRVGGPSVRTLGDLPFGCNRPRRSTAPLPRRLRAPRGHPGTNTRPDQSSSAREGSTMRNTRVQLEKLALPIPRGPGLQPVGVLPSGRVVWRIAGADGPEPITVSPMLKRLYDERQQ